MSIDSLKALMEDFDPSKFLPNLTTVFGKMELILRIAVIVGPVVLLILGLTYMFLSPKEANHSFGYRCYFGMGSMEAWSFSQRLGGLVWAALGLILTIIMVLTANGFRDLTTEAMVWKAIKCLFWEIGLALASILCVNITVMVFFDRKGNRRFGRSAKEE